MQALDALANSAHPARWPVADVVARDRRISFLGVPAVGVGQLGRLAGLFGGPDAAAGFQGADP